MSNNSPSSLKPYKVKISAGAQKTIEQENTKMKLKNSLIPHSRL